MIKEAGIEGLTLRKLASALDYSTTKLYHEYGGKDELILILAEDISQRQNDLLEGIKKGANAEEHLLRVIHEATKFYTNEPWSAQILAAVRFTFKASEMPPAFVKATENYRNWLVALNLSALSTKEALDYGMYVTRFLSLGALSTLRPDSKKSEKDLVINIVDEGMRLIVAGWKSLSK